MALYYHGTSVQNLENIMLNGLDPAYCDRSEEEPMPFVFLAYSVRDAADFAPGGACHRNTDASQGVVLAIYVPEDVEAQFVFDLGEYVRVPFVIHPKYISVVAKEKK